MSLINHILSNGVDEAKNIILAWYPWFNKKEVIDYLTIYTPWPLITNDKLRTNICVAHLKIWDQYVDLVRKNGYDIDESDKPKPNINPELLEK